MTDKNTIVANDKLSSSDSVNNTTDKLSTNQNISETDSENKEGKVIDLSSDINIDNWESLTIDMIGTSFKVIADLPIGAKLKIVDKTHLAEDTSYLTSLARYSAGQGRNKIISFLDHLYYETERNIEIIINNIRVGNNIDTNISNLRGIIGKVYIFLHRYEIMRNVYKNDSSAFARLGIIRDKFYTFMDTFFRNMVIK